jgi:hypothetical protein
MYPGDTYLSDPWTWVNYFYNPGPAEGLGAAGCPPLPTFVFPDRKARSKVGIVFTPLPAPGMPTDITLSGSHNGVNWFTYPGFQVPNTSLCFCYTVNTGPIIMLQMSFSYNACSFFNVGVIPFGE